MATYEKSFLLSLYRDMVRIRAFEEHAAECFTKGMLAGNIHLSIGQEAAEAGAFAAIEPRDYFTSTHRGHGHAIARGADPKRAMAELFGKAAGYCKGKGGSMHIADMEKMNHLGANGIVGAGQPISAGSALASKIMGDDSVTVGGLTIALELFGETFISWGYTPEIIHRVASIACGGLDTLPWNGTVVMLFALSGVSYKKGYKHVAMETVILPLLSLIPVFIYYSIVHLSLIHI